MIVVDLLLWWYSRGLMAFCARLVDRLRGALSFFSIGALVRTLFAPFRQISSGRVEGEVPLKVRIDAFFDRLFSRCVGAVVRLFLMIIGLAVFLIGAAISLALVILWILMPLIPVICIILAVSGVDKL